MPFLKPKFSSPACGPWRVIGPSEIALLVVAAPGALFEIVKVCVIPPGSLAAGIGPPAPLGTAAVPNAPAVYVIVTVPALNSGCVESTGVR